MQIHKPYPSPTISKYPGLDPGSRHSNKLRFEDHCLRQWFSATVAQNTDAWPRPPREPGVWWPWKAVKAPFVIPTLIENPALCRLHHR